MDTRFPPIPRTIKTPLYPNKSKIDLKPVNKNAKEKLKDSLCQILNAPENEVLLFSSASTAIYLYLNFSSGPKTLKVALPAFNCIDLAHAIIRSGNQPVFLDLDNEVNLSEKSVDFAIKNNCQFIIWPSYFGTRNRADKLISKLKKAGIKIIFDDAQSFPADNPNYYTQNLDKFDALAISFGPSKKIPGSGGGAIYLPSQNSLIKKISNHIDKYELPQYQTASYLKNKIQVKLFNASPTTSIKLKIQQKPFKNLDILLNNSSPKEFSNLHISYRQAHDAIIGLDKYFKLLNFHQTNFFILEDTVQRTFGKNSTVFLKTIIDTPSIMAIKIDKDKRYEILEYFSKKNIQATWYYYPLNMVTNLKNYPTQNTVNTNKISSCILILPFQWVQSKKQFDKLLKSIKEYGSANK